MNKEEHLGRETAAFLKPRGSIGQGEATLLLRLSDVLAERDAAREELAQARNRIEFLENGAAPVDAAQPAEDVAPKLREALALSLGADPSRPIWALVNEAIGRIRFLEVAAQPESAPVVGGVTELMLDEIQHLVDQYPYCPGVDESASAWITSARAAIRAQKRVDVEAIREVAHATYVAPGHGHKLLRAIGDEPAEAPVAEERCKTLDEWRRKHAEPAAPDASAVPSYTIRASEFPINVLDLLVRTKLAASKADARRLVTQGAVSYMHTYDTSALKADVTDFAFDIATDLTVYVGKTKAAFVSVERDAEPAAPAQEQEGPFTDNGGFGWINDNGVAQLKAINEEAAKRYTRLLNAGLEAPKLRARVAELEAKVAKREAQFLEAITARPEATQALRNLSDALGLAADSPAWGWQIDNMAADRLRSEKARADAAEAKLAEVEPILKSLRDGRGTLSLESIVRRLDREIELSSKLAALGDNPIPRALGERWHSYASGLQSGAWFAELLAGREPGAAS